jgi:hypothetical protein
MCNQLFNWEAKFTEKYALSFTSLGVFFFKPCFFFVGWLMPFLLFSFFCSFGQKKKRHRRKSAGG